MFLRHPFVSVATLAYIALVGWLTLSPQSTIQEQGILDRLVRFFERHDATDWLTYPRVEFGLNVAMFIPFGIFFVLLLGRRRWWLVILLCIALTLTIEFAQQGIPGRVSDPRDLVSNSAGAVLGALAALVLRPPAARRIRARTTSSGAHRYSA